MTLDAFSVVLVLAFLFAIFLCPAQQAIAATDYYLKIDGISGESGNPKYQDYMMVSSWSWGSINSSDTNKVSALGALKQSLPQELDVMMETSKASPQLMQATFSGKHFASGELVGLDQASGSDQELFKITFSDIIISGYKVGNSQNNVSPTEQVSLNFAKVELENSPGTSATGTSTTGTATLGTSAVYQIPSWVKNNAKFWSNGDIGDSEFVKGIQYLIQQEIMKVPPSQAQTTTPSNQVPSWVKNNAKFWSNGDIGDSEFVKGIQYLIDHGIIKLKNS